MGVFLQKIDKNSLKANLMLTPLPEGDSAIGCSLKKNLLIEGVAMVLRSMLTLLIVVLGAEQLAAQPPAYRQALRAERLQAALVKGKETLLKTGKQALLAALTGAMLAITVPLAADDGNWQRINSRSAAHLKSGLYFVLDSGDFWRVMHAVFIGVNENEVPMFVGLHAHTVMRNAKGVAIDILDEVESSLVGYEGLIKQGVEIEIQRIFEHPKRPVYDLALFTVEGVDMSGYRPVEIEIWPMKMLDELEMLSYRIDMGENVLGIFGYPAMRRDCFAGKFVVPEGLAWHSCAVPRSPATIGSLIYAKKRGTLVAFHFSFDDDGVPYGITAAADLVRISQLALDVHAQQKLPTTWADIKLSRLED